MTRPLLALESIHTGYGEVQVIHGVTMAVAEGSITALVGSNGAGKSTLLRAVVGLLPVRAGRIVYRGEDITGSRPSDRVASGIALVPEGRLVFPDFTVEENLLVGGFTARVRPDRRRLMEELYERYPILRERRRQLAGTLSGGQQQILAVARGLMSRPSLLLLDEPSLGLSPQAVAALFSMIVEIRQSGVTVLLVEQNVRTTLEIADAAFVLEVGEIVLAGAGADLLEDDKVRRAYLGL